MIYLSRIFDANLIPRRLVEDDKERDFSVEEFYQVMPHYLSSPQTHVFLILSADREVIGYLWHDLNILGGEAFINTLSIDKRYRNGGQVLKEIFDIFKGSFYKAGIKKVKILSSRARRFEQMGFKRAPQVYLELDLQE